MREIKNKKYWEFKNLNDNEADLYLYIEIASWGGGYSAHSAKSFKQELDDLGEIKTLNIYINSPGGDVFEGIAIYNMLKRHKAHVNVHVDGLAASISSVIAMAGDTIYMPTNSMMMIHNAWMWTAGDSNELKVAAEMLEKVNTSIRQSYMDKAGSSISEEDLTKLMDDETWLTAQECLDYGFCTEIKEDTNIAASTNKELFSKYRNTPKNLLNKTKEPETVAKDEEIEILLARVNNTLKFEEELINE